MFHARLICTIIIVMYSGQQKSATSSTDPDPGPPPLDRPKPWPRMPVSATVLPAVTWAPRVGVRPRASSGALFTGLASAAAAFVGFAFGSGIVISGALAAGGRTGSRLTGSSGGFSFLVRRPPRLTLARLVGRLHFRDRPPTHRCHPAVLGAVTAAAAQRDRHHRWRRVRVMEQAAGREDHQRREQRMRRDRHGHHPLQAAGLLHAVAQHVGNVHYRSPGMRATMPTFCTPAAFSASKTSIRS